MGMLLRAAVLLSSLLLCSAFLDLSGPSEIKAVWKGPITLPCAYVPVEDFVQQTLTWSVAHDQSSGTIFRRDGSGDHVFLSEYRDRVSVPKDTPGNVSLVILNLEISDRGTYTCQVTWRASNNSLISKETMTKVEVVKVAATKPVIRAGQLGLTVPAGASTSLTCEASGSPPISYRWFRSSPGGKVLLQSSGAQLAWDSLRPSDSGTYFCEAANRVGAGVAQQSDAVQLTVTDLPTTTAASWRDVGTPGRHHLTTVQEKTQTEQVFRGTSGISWTPWGSITTTDLPITVTAVTSKSGVEYPERNYTTQDFQRTGLSLYLVVLIAVVCGAVVFLVIFLIICIRKPKDAQVYDVKLHNSRAAASSRHESTGHYEEPISFTENNYVMEPMENKGAEVNKNVSDCVGNPQEHEYEVGDTS
ncbi:V-set and immunoglobulin domain-containing protein 4-like isoform X2 [Neopelma chrysocephalum]|uniref:V-set and immunoglobulin domain-containing protein 4-like isoform X2 n=1 Tax=Neopelma chrysocephalum TaxID=114329 RepID=UPI000FCD2CBB|nr:V-set and immunoglobulin domain-containing protein 4-like isoform X2 [Neopelma chrysocephalum]